MHVDDNCISMFAWNTQNVPTRQVYERADKFTCTMRCISCKHTCAVITYMQHTPENYCDWFMTIQAFKVSYTLALYPIPDFDKSEVVVFFYSVCLPFTLNR